MSDPSEPVYLIKGDDPGLVADALQSLIDELVGDEDPSFVVEVLSAEETTATSVIDTCQTPPFFANQRIVLVRDIGNYKAEQATALADYLDAPMPTTTLVCVAGGGQTSPKLTAAVRKHGHLIDAALPSGGKARTAWLNERLKDSPVVIAPSVRPQLAAHLGEDLGRLTGLFEALVAAYGEGAEVGLDEIVPFLGELGSIAPWDFTDAIDRGDTDLALRNLHRMLAAGQRHPLVIMATLQRHFTAMLRLDGSGVSTKDDAAALLQMSPYPAQKVLAQSRKIGRDNIFYAITLLHDADLALRGATGWDEGLVLEVLVARLSRLASGRPARRAPVSA